MGWDRFQNARIAHLAGCFEQLLPVPDQPAFRSRHPGLLCGQVGLPFVQARTQGPPVRDYQRIARLQFSPEPVQKDEVMIPRREQDAPAPNVLSQLQQKRKEFLGLAPGVRAGKALRIASKVPVDTPLRRETYYGNAFLAQATINTEPRVEHLHYDGC